MTTPPSPSRSAAHSVTASPTIPRRFPRITAPIWWAPVAHWEPGGQEAPGTESGVRGCTTFSSKALHFLPAGKAWTFIILCPHQLNAPAAALVFKLRLEPERRALRSTEKRTALETDLLAERRRGSRPAALAAPGPLQGKGPGPAPSEVTGAQ